MLNTVVPSDLFCEYYAQWIKMYKEGAIRKVTMDKYLMTQAWLKKLIPETRVCDMTRVVYQQLLNDYATTHERQTTMDFHHQLKGAILDAVDDGLIERDPTRKAIIKGKTPTEKKIKYLNQFELHTLLTNLDLHGTINWDWFILLVAKTGMRFSEALALTPKDFDFAHQTLSISKTWDYKGNSGFLPTKNKSSVRKIIFDDHAVIEDCANLKNKFKNVNFAIISGCSFYGKSRCDKNAGSAYAIIIDLDEVGKNELVNLLYLFDSGIAPLPTAINVSGNGVHVVYMLSHPVTLTQDMKKKLTEARKRLTEIIWNARTTRKKGKIEHQPLVQGYRMVGSVTKKGHTCRSFLVGKKISYDTILDAVGISDFDASKTTIDEAKDLWPEWYQRRIVEGQPKGHITIGRSMYDKYLDAIKEGAVPGHRFHCIFYLGAIAQRCDISREELEKDAFSLLELFDSRSDSEENRFTATDINCALSAFDENDFTNINIKWIEKRTGITYPRRLKSDRKQGRPSLENEIRSYMKANPGKSISDIARECHVSRTTVYKYLGN